MGLCYRCPNADREEIVSLSRLIRKHTDEAAIIMGDFNYGEINWETLEATAEGAEFLEMVQDCFLTQHVMEPTRDSNRTVDLVLSTEAGLVEDIDIGCPVANSDHYTITFKIPCKDTILKCKKERWCYNNANYNEICQQLESVQWESLVEGKDVEQEWFTIKGAQ